MIFVQVLIQSNLGKSPRPLLHTHVPRQMGLSRGSSHTGTTPETTDKVGTFFSLVGLKVVSKLILHIYISRM